MKLKTNDLSVLEKYGFSKIILHEDYINLPDSKTSYEVVEEDSLFKDYEYARYTNKIPVALRFYENETKQRAIFTDVVSFRDMSIEIQEEIVNTQTKDGYVECDGVRKRTTFEASTREWVNPDTYEDNKLLPAPPSDEEIYQTDKIKRRK